MPTAAEVGAATKDYVDEAVALADTYELPIATAASLGGVKIGANVTAAADGTISVATPGITQSNADNRYLQLASPNASGTISWSSQNNLQINTASELRVGNTAGTLAFRPILTMPAIEALSPQGQRTRLVLAASDIDCLGSTLSSVGTPTLSNEAANKGYVDNAVAGVGGGLPTANPNDNTLSIGWKTVLASSQGLAIEHNQNILNSRRISFFVDNTDTAIIARSPTGTPQILKILASSISVASSRITSVATPTDPTDAVNKAYVDAKFAELAALLKPDEPDKN